MQKKFLIVLGVVLLLVAFYFGWLKFRDTFSDEPAPLNTSQNQPSDSEESEQQPVQSAEFDKTKYSVDEPGSIWWVVNRQRPLPDNYRPNDLVVPDVSLRLGVNSEQMQIRQIVESSIIDMFNAAKASSITLVFGSGFRSEALQAQFYNNYVASDGQLAADRYSARPGTSEHQTGLSFDVTNTSRTCHLEVCFEDTAEGQWVKANAYKYGFIVRYPEGKENITGYQYEPWHLRYVGKDLANEIKSTSQAMEEFFGLDPVPFP